MVCIIHTISCKLFLKQKSCNTAVKETCHYASAAFYTEPKNAGVVPPLVCGFRRRARVWEAKQALRVTQRTCTVAAWVPSCWLGHTCRFGPIATSAASLKAEQQWPTFSICMFRTGTERRNKGTKFQVGLKGPQWSSTGEPITRVIFNLCHH